MNNSSMLEQEGACNEGDPEKQQSKAKKWILRILVVILIALLALFIYYKFFDNTGTAPIVAGDRFPGARTAEELREAMQEEVDVNTFNFEINARPVFPNGSSRGNLFYMKKLID